MENNERSVDEDGTIRINMGRLYEVSFVKEPLHPAWRVELVHKDQELMFTEWNTETKDLEDFYGFTNWKKANDEYFKKLFDLPRDPRSTAGDPFRKQSVKEVQEGLNKLIRSIWLHPITAEREFEIQRYGRWNEDKDQ